MIRVITSRVVVSASSGMPKKSVMLLSPNLLFLQGCIKQFGQLQIANTAGMKPIAANILWELLQVISLSGEIHQDNMMAPDYTGDCFVVGHDLLAQGNRIVAVEKRHAGQVRDVAHRDTSMRCGCLQMAEQDIEIVAVGCDRDISCQIVNRQPDRHQVRTRVECNWQLGAQSRMNGHARHAQVNQMDWLLEQERQLTRPVICIGIIGANAKGVRGANRHVGQGMGLITGQSLTYGCAGAFPAAAQEKKSAEREGQQRQARRKSICWNMKQTSTYRTNIPRLLSLVLIVPGQLLHKEANLSDDLNEPLLNQPGLTLWFEEAGSLFFCQAYGCDP